MMHISLLLVIPLVFAEDKESYLLDLEDLYGQREATLFRELTVWSNQPNGPQAALFTHDSEEICKLIKNGVFETEDWYVPKTTDKFNEYRRMTFRDTKQHPDQTVKENIPFVFSDIVNGRYLMPHPSA